MWTYDVLNSLPKEGVGDITSLLECMESQAEIPTQFSLHTVCLEPCFGVNTAGYGGVCWKTLIEDYKSCAPWDSAVPGRCSLDVGIRRVLRAEALQLKGVNFASIVIDISGVYDNVQWADIVSEGLNLHYPPILLELCLQI